MKRVIKSPLVSEKNAMFNSLGLYVFEVDMKATKPEIKSAIEKNFKVKVVSVNTSICRGHSRRNKFGLSPVPYWKKAFVRLAEGEKISLFEGV